jgi:hypothetical protein
MTTSERAFQRKRSRTAQVRSRRLNRKKAAPIVRAPKRSVPRGSQRIRYRYEATRRLENRPRLHSPLFPAISLRVRTPALLLLAIVIWQIIRVMTQPAFKVEEAMVNGSHYLSPSRVQAIAGIAGRPIFEVDPSAIKRELEALPEISSAKVFVKWPNDVVINLTERQPVLEWNDAGEVWLICADGLAFYRQEIVLGLVAVHSLTPVLEIDKPMDPVLSQEMIQAAITLSESIGEERMLFYDPSHGFGFQDDRGWMAYFGSQGNIDLKLRLYSRIADRLDEMNYPASLVSVENPEIPFYR